MLGKAAGALTLLSKAASRRRESSVVDSLDRISKVGLNGTCTVRHGALWWCSVWSAEAGRGVLGQRGHVCTGEGGNGEGRQWTSLTSTESAPLRDCHAILLPRRMPATCTGGSIVSSMRAHDAFCNSPFWGELK